jgi:hypothetical protein
MKKILKGCLIASLVLIGIVVVIGAGIYFYSKTPNNIVVLSKPLKISDLKDDLYFPEGNIPNFIQQANEDDIVYQATVNYNDWARECRYILLMRPKKGSINLKNKLPIINNDLEKINELLKFHELQNPFLPYIELPEKMETEPGIRIQVYNPNMKEILNLHTGSYQFHESRSIDKDGYYTEVILFDEKSNLLYYERMRFHAFQ